MRVGRTSLRETPSGIRICRDFLDGGFCQGIDGAPVRKRYRDSTSSRVPWITMLKQLRNIGTTD
jgi:hypothetical protein